MVRKPTYEELEQKVKELEEKSVRIKETEEAFRALLNASTENSNAD